MMHTSRSLVQMHRKPNNVVSTQQRKHLTSSRFLTSKQITMSTYGHKTICGTKSQNFKFCFEKSITHVTLPKSDTIVGEPSFRLGKLGDSVNECMRRLRLIS